MERAFAALAAATATDTRPSTADGAASKCDGAEGAAAAEAGRGCDDDEAREISGGGSEWLDRGKYGDVGADANERKSV